MREKQAQGSIYVGSRSYGRACVTAQSFLIDNNRDIQVVDFVHIRNADVLQPVSDKTALCFAELPLGFSTYGFKDQRRLARSGDSCKNSDLFLGDLERNILEIILSGMYNVTCVSSIVPFIALRRSGIFYAVLTISFNHIDHMI
ncbi:hypothetical protein [Sphingobacterium multivorum]|uniref:hypothetical protein n=1 Tax=Sphingobacterium multivorum TaxID=28454 RepID=UPI003DA645E5